MDSRYVIFKVHETIERELPTSDVEKRATLVELKLMMSIEVTLQRKLIVEDVLSFMQEQRDVVKTMQTLKRLALKRKLTSKWRVEFQAFQFDINVKRVVIRRDCHNIIFSRSTRFLRTSLLAIAQRDEVVNDKDLSI
jgi:hypothetical protein